MAHVGTDSPLSTGAARTGRLRVECSRDGQTRLFLRFFCAFALAKLAKMEAQHRQTLKNSRILIAREKNSVDSPHRRWNFTLHSYIAIKTLLLSSNSATVRSAKGLLEKGY